MCLPTLSSGVLTVCSRWEFRGHVSNHPQQRRPDGVFQVRK